MSMAIAGAVVGVAAAGAQAYGAHQAANAQEKAAGQAAGTQAAQDRLIQQQQAPYRQIGLGATNQLAQLYGIQGAQEDTRQVGGFVHKPSDIIRLLNQGMSVDDILQTGVLGPKQGPKEIAMLQAAGLSTEDISRLESGTFTPLDRLGAQPGTPGAPGANGQPDYSGFFNSPDYQFALQQGGQAVDRSAAAGGRLASGNTLAAAQQYGQGLATQNYQNYLSGLRGLAGMGQEATNNANQFGYNSAAGIADTQVGAGAARASGITGQYNALGRGLGAGVNALGSWMNRPQGQVRINDPVGGFSPVQQQSTYSRLFGQ